MINGLGSAVFSNVTPARSLEQQTAQAPVSENDVNNLITSIETEENPNGLLARLSSEATSVLLQAQEDETNAEGLTPEEQEVVDDLKQTDQEVRAHEQSHKSAAGPYAGPISYETVTGPDGREYAVGGSVQIDVSPIPGNPEATIQKAEIVERAALAPAQPSSEDFAVARAAQQLRQQAQAELAEQKQEEQREASEGDESGSSGEVGSATNNTLDLSQTQTILNAVNQLV